MSDICYLFLPLVVLTMVRLVTNECSRVLNVMAKPDDCSPLSKYRIKSYKS